MPTPPSETPPSEMPAGAASLRAAAPQLLAPAGDWDALRAAVANGADAVYFGLSNFNARHRAHNFTPEELPEVMAFLHAHNVQGFLTFNTLIFSEELPDAIAYTQLIAAAGVDAVLVQDLGLAQLIHTLAPTLAIHASTQMTLTEPRGIDFVRQFGITRIVLARELSLGEIRQIAAALSPLPSPLSPVPSPLSPAAPAPPELEVFIHGALCVAYSGQCLTSEALGGRSANRGQCAQACRLPYELLVDGQLTDTADKAYLLSPQDLAAYDLIADLTAAGVHCFKIEGRLKSAHYVAATTQTYRQAIDATISNLKFQISSQQRLDLEQSFSRGFTHGFLSGVNHQQLVHARFPKSRGTRIGTVAAVFPRTIHIQLDSPPPARPSLSGAQSSVLSPQHFPLKPGDGVCFDEGHPEQDEQGGRIYHVRTLPNHQLEITLGEGDINLSYINPGAIVWKTDDPAIRKRLEHSFSRDTIAKRTPLAAHIHAHVGGHLTLTLTAEGRSATATWSDKPLEKANKFPLTSAAAREQLSRLGDTPYELAEVTLDESGSPMVPKSVLNDLRRQAIARLLELRARAHPIANLTALESLRAAAAAAPQASIGPGPSEIVTGLSAFSIQHSALPPSLYVLVRTLGQLDAVLSANVPLRPAALYCDFEDVRRYKEAVARCRAAAMPIALATLRIVKPHEHGTLRQIADCQPDAVLVRNLAAVSYYHELFPTLPQIGDYALNIANELTARIFADAGLVRMVPSYDLSWKQLAAMVRRSDPARFETVIHQHMPMFHMEHCVFAHMLSNGKDFRDCGRPCDTHQLDLRETRSGVGLAHPLIPDVGCRNTLYNALAQSAAEFVPEMLAVGLRHFRIEFLRDPPAEIPALLTRYGNVLLGKEPAAGSVRSLRVLHQLGVTRGTLDRE